MVIFWFRVWSSHPGESRVHECASQDSALYVFHNVREMDRIDYKANDGQGWRYVDPEELQRVGIEHIYEIDSRHDAARRLIYLVVGIAMAAVGAMLWIG